jgi:hypothetical protein
MLQNEELLFSQRCVDERGALRGELVRLWVSNSLSDGDRELDKVVAVGDPPHTT